ncbi:MAG: hypothetical protein ABI821_01720 [Pseudomonadota bacterium]
MSLVHSQNAAPCRFRGEHPTVARPASRVPLMTGATRTRAGVLCMSTARGIRASSRPRLRDSNARRPAARNPRPRRSS